MAKPPAPGVRVRKWSSGAWSEVPDAVVTEEPLQLMLDGVPLSVVMRTPGEDIELALGLMFAEGIVRSLDAIGHVRISAESGETASGISVDSSLVESNQIDVQLAEAPRRRPERSMLSSSACGVCGAVLSGRAGYEIVQKSITAGMPLLAAVGAPSSLAVALSREFNQTLVGFLRGERFNVYAAPERLAS